MLAEALTIFACVNAAGCSETSNAYFNHHPEVRRMIEVNEEKARKMVGPVAVHVLGPIAFAVAGGTANIRLAKHCSLQVNKNNLVAVYGIDF